MADESVKLKREYKFQKWKKAIVISSRLHYVRSSPIYIKIEAEAQKWISEFYFYYAVNHDSKSWKNTVFDKMEPRPATLIKCEIRPGERQWREAKLYFQLV